MLDVPESLSAEPLMDVGSAGFRLISSLERCHEDTLNLISGDQPAFLSRIGGSDTDVVLLYFGLLGKVGRERALDQAIDRFSLVRRYNGYYDKLGDLTKVEKFCELLIDSYRKTKINFVVGSPLLSEFFPESINPIFRVDTTADSDLFRDFFRSMSLGGSSPCFYPYSYIERILIGKNTLFRAFEQSLPGKRVLAVSPFAVSIKKNFHRRLEFFKSYKYPNFELETYNAPITYEGLPESMYPDTDWFETLERMKAEISNIEFDVALLSCGSYAVPLGIYVRDILKKKAVYVGGCLQLFFGIMGRRYENSWFTDQINQDAFIHPVERDTYLQHVHIAADTATEAFGAYF